LQIAELEFAHQLRVDQLTLEPGRILVHEVKARLAQLEAGTLFEPRGLQRVANVEVGPADRMFADVQPETKQAVHQYVVVGDEIGEIVGDDRQIGIGRL